MGPVKSWVNSHASTIDKFPLSPKCIAEIIKSIDDEIINFSVAEQKLFPALLSNPIQEVSQVIEDLNLRQTGDEDTLYQLIQDVLSENAHKVKEYKLGKTGLIGMFMGQIMKKSGGKADPKKTKSLLFKLLDN
jgi:aspartyl-tRNA(Asn)/glutamyl-tRNA(Gln) amidotransferase subunit B